MARIFQSVTLRHDLIYPQQAIMLTEDFQTRLLLMNIVKPPRYSAYQGQDHIIPPD